MGAVPVLIVLAAVGVDYGWQPDGTTSQRGDNVEYIIQIPPHQLEQIRSAGEITSTIDPAIQGRVSRIVVKVGSGPLPKDSGRAKPLTGAGAAPSVTHAVAIADDATQIPIPEIASDSLAQSAPDQTEGTSSESLMKPDPQAGGFSLPENIGNAVGTNPAVSTDPAASGRDDRWGDISGRVGSNANGSAPAAGVDTTPAGPSTDPVDSGGRTPAALGSGAAGVRSPGEDHSRATMAVPNAAAQQSASGSGGGNAASAQAVGAPSHRPTDPSDPSWSGYGTTPNFGTLPPGLAPSAGITRPPSGSQFAGATDPRGDAQRASTTAGSAPPTQSFARDATGHSLDRLGRPIDSEGRLIDPDTGHLVDGAGNWIDEYGRQIDRLGRPLAREPGSSTGQTGNANLQAPLLPSQHGGATAYAQTPNNQSVYGQANYAQPPQATAPNYANSAQPNPNNPGQPAAYQPVTGHSPTTGYPTTSAYPPQAGYQNPAGYPVTGATPPPGAHSSVAQPIQYTQAPTAQEPRQTQAGNLSRSGRSYDDEDDFRSPSDLRRATARSGSDDRELDRNTAAAKPTAVSGNRSRTVAAQPFFNFVLLISLVGNAYLIYETGNLRRKFRNMIANVRASKLSAQPAG